MPSFPKDVLMQRIRYIDQITSAEWRWVLLCSTALVLLALAPFALLPMALDSDVGIFMGAVHDPDGTAAALATVRLGMQDEWLWRSLHTPEPQTGVVSDMVYIMLGHAARLGSVDPLVIFHVARVLAGLFMFHAIYALSAAIWSRVNTRRIFWFLASVGAGLGWVVLPLSQRVTPDTATSLIFPFHTVLMNAHLPLAVGCLCFLAAAMLDSLRPDQTSMPAVTNSGLTLIVFSITLALVYASAFIPLTLAYGAALALDAQRRRLPRRNLFWFGWFVIPALPLLTYYVTVSVNNPVVRQLWALDLRVPVPDVPLLLAAVGLPLLIALPGLWRAVRRFEPDGSRFMLIWLLAMLVLAYTLPGMRGTLLLGLMLPLAYFAARASEDFWLPLLPNRRVRYGIIAALVPVMVASHGVALLSPLIDPSPRLTVPTDYAAAFSFLRGRTRDGVVLAAPHVSVWAPAWTGRRVVYAAPSLTLVPTSKAAAVIRFYAEDDPEACAAQLARFPSVRGRYTVRYVLYGPLERELGDSACLDALVEIARFGSVNVYLATG